MYIFFSKEQYDKFIKEFVYDGKRNWALNKIVVAWEKLDCKRLRMVITEDVILYEEGLKSINGANQVLQCHSIWFDRIKESIGKYPCATGLSPRNMRDNDNYFLNIQDYISSNDFLFSFRLNFRENKISEIEILHDDFIRIMKKYENRINQ